MKNEVYGCEKVLAHRPRWTWLEDYNCGGYALRTFDWVGFRFPHSRDNASQQVDGQILLRHGIGVLAGAEQHQHGMAEDQSQSRQRSADAEQQKERIPHDEGCLLLALPAALHGKQWRTTHAAEVGKGRNQRDDGQTYS